MFSHATTSVICYAQSLARLSCTRSGKNNLESGPHRSDDIGVVKSTAASVTMTQVRLEYDLATF